MRRGPPTRLAGSSRDGRGSASPVPLQRCGARGGGRRGEVTAADQGEGRDRGDDGACDGDATMTGILDRLERGGQMLCRYPGVNAAMGQICVGHGDDDLELDWEGPRRRRLDAGFTERAGRLYRPAIREQLAAILKEHDSVAQQVSALLWIAGQGPRGRAVRCPGRRARRLVLAHRHASCRERHRHPISRTAPAVSRPGAGDVSTGRCVSHHAAAPGGPASPPSRAGTTRVGAGSGMLACGAER